MKKFILWSFAFLWIASVALFSFSTPRRVVAQEPQTYSVTAPSVGGYACICTDTAYFYQSKHADSGLFLLPESYFVKILETGETYCKIEYLYDDTHVKKLIGYALTAQLTFVDYVPERPYLYCLFNLRYTLEDAFDGNGFLDDITVLCAYYGDYTVGSKTYCYVLQGEEFGYVPKPSDLSIEKNTEYADRLAATLPPEDDAPKDESPTQSNPAQIAILVALCLLVPILAALILKPPRRPPYESE
ncbi:MAG: hypothetical protein IKA40_05750 [Clostridia bacterium]|nr:hypothetical protein [Clostridia bacterium]